MRGFTIYNKVQLFNMIDKISIERSGNTITTKYDNRVINTTQVSNRYEIFDIAKYLKDKINIIESNFPIYMYKLEVKGGKQTLQLISDKVEINGVDFYKSFYILNSSDKSRRLSFSIGLRSESKDFYLVGNNASLLKKHLKGVTQAAEDASLSIDAETFNDQLSSIESLVGHNIKFSKLREIILDNENFDEVANINHRKFDAFKNSIRWSTRVILDTNQRNFLYTPSERMNDFPDNLDFFVDAFYAFQLYLTIFNRQDANIVKKETEKIMKITQWSVRNSILESLGI
jgi:hypothetical protein